MRLNISNNVISNFDGELNTYLYIYSLDASNNQLTDTQAFKNIGYSLRVLYLNGNNFSVLNNHAFGDLQLLEILNLADSLENYLAESGFNTSAIRNMYR